MAAFPNSYQIRLLALLCLDRQLYLQYADLIETTHFTTLVSQWIFGEISRFFGEYRKLPTRNSFETELSKEDAFAPLPEEQSLLQEFLALLSAGVVADDQYVKDTLIQYISARSMRSILNEQSENVEKGSFEEVLNALRDGRKLITLPDSKLKSGRIFAMGNLEEILVKNVAIKTGFSLIDETVGGLIRKELTLIMGDTKVGKSMMLSQIGGYIVKQYRKVLHVSLEMSVARTLARYFTNMSEDSGDSSWVTYNNIVTMEPSDEVLDYVDSLREKYEGYLFVEELPTGKGSIENIYGLVEKYQPEVLILDYLDLFKPPKRRQDLRFELKDVTTAIRGLAVELNIPILTATQTSRLASGRRLVRKEFVAEDYEKIRLSDVVASMGQNKIDKEKREMVLFLVAVRNVEGNKAVRYFFDNKKMRFKYMNEENLSGFDGS